MQLFVKNLTGQTLTFTVQDSTTTANVMDSIYAREGRDYLLYTYLLPVYLII